MNRRSDCGLDRILAGCLVLIALPQAVRADDSSWASRPRSYLAQPGVPLDSFQRRSMGCRSELEDYWERQRAAQQESAQDRVHAWYGNHDGYYPSQFRTPTVPFERSNSTYPPAAYGGCRGHVPGDLCFDYDCDSLELINFDDLCGDHSPVDCLKALHHTGRR